MKEAGIEIPANRPRSNFHLYNKLDKLLEESGWEVILVWEQNAPFPVLGLEEKNEMQKKFLYSSFSSFPEEVR